jgi:hypothetical protein
MASAFNATIQDQFGNAISGADNPELVTNGTFDSDTDWTKDTGWTISDGAARGGSGGNNTKISQQITTVIGVSYMLTCKVNSILGTFSFEARENTVFGAVLAGATLVAGNNAVYFTATSTTTAVNANDYGTSIIIDNISVKLHDAAITVRVDDAGGALAMIYSDEEGLVPLSNPFTSEADGLAQFWADAGTYYIEAVSGGVTSDGWTIELGGVGGTIAVFLTEAAAIGEAVTFDGALVEAATIDEAMGLALAAGGIGGTISTINEGNITVGSWAWTPDEFVYLTTSGTLTQTPPATAHRRIGIATTATTIAVRIDPTVREVGGAGSENAIPALSDSGLADYTMIDKAATGGAGAENKLVQADGSGFIDTTFLTQVIDTTGQFTASGAITAGGAVSLTAARTVAATDAGNVANFIGFSEATVADAATVEISLPTDVNTNQTGLAFGSTYYLLDDGTLSTTDTDGNGAVGYALSATKLLNTKEWP